MKTTTKKKCISALCLILTFVITVGIFNIGYVAFAVPEDDNQTEGEAAQTPESGDENSQGTESTEDNKEPDSDSEEKETGNGSSNSGSGSSSSSSGHSSSGTGTTSGNASSGTDSGRVAVSSTTSNKTTDTRLSSLTISCGELIPEFSPDTYEYVVYVSPDSEDKSCQTLVEAMSENVDITAEGPREYGDESVEKRVIITADDGGKSEYVIDVHVVKDYELLIDGALYVPSDKIDTDSLPGDFNVEETEISGAVFPCAVSSDGNIRLVCLAKNDDEKDIRWYLLDDDNKIDARAKIEEIDGEKMLLLDYEGQMAYGEGGFYLVNISDGEKFRILTDDSSGIAEKSHSFPNFIVVVLAGIIIVLIITIAYILLKRKKAGKNSDKQQIKYFMPYLHIEEEEKDSDGQQKKTPQQ